MNKKTKIALLSVTSNTTLLILKLIAGILSGSISIVSEAIHSGMDLIASLIAFLAVKKIMEPSALEQAFLAVAVMVFSGFVNLFASHMLHKVAVEEDSQALEADSLHLRTDVYTSLSVGVGVLLVKLTGISVLDPIVAIFVALLIIKEAWHLCRGAFEYLIDVKLSDEEENEIREIIETHRDSFLDYQFIAKYY